MHNSLKQAFSNSCFLFDALQHILYRQKEQFSDGVGYSWIDGLKAHAAQHVYASFLTRFL